MTTFTQSVSNAIDNSSKIRLYLVFFIIISIAISWLGVIDKQSTDYIDGALIDASWAFFIAKTLNALISVMQSFTVEFKAGAAAGAGIAIGEAIDPINDLIEEYSSLMKLAIGSLFVQKILLEIVSDFAFKLLLTVSGLVSIVGMYLANSVVVRFLLRFFIFALFLRFSLVLVVALNGVADHMFLNEQTKKEIATTQLEDSAEKLTPQERKTLIDAIRALKERKIDIEKNIELKKRDFIVLSEEITKIEAEIENVESTLPTMQRLNVFNTDERLVPLKEKLQELISKREQIEQVGKKLESELSDVTKDAEFAQLTLDGKAGSLLNSLSNFSFNNAIDSIKSAVSLEKLMAMKDWLDSISDNVLKTMALFFLKTLILPLLFLFFITRVFKTIWQIDPARYIPALKPLSGGKAAE